MTSKSDPAKDWSAVTPSDTTVHNPPLRGLWVGTTGDVAIESASGNTATFVGVQGILPCENIRRVLATDTTATDIVGLL